MDLTSKCRFCLGDHDSINVLSYLDGKIKLFAVLDKITGLEVSIPFFALAKFRVCLLVLFLNKNLISVPRITETASERVRVVFRQGPRDIFLPAGM